MTAALSRRRDAARTEYVVQRLMQPQDARSMLHRDLAFAAYAIAQLEPDRFAAAEWYAASALSGERALVAHTTSGLGRALFAQGDTEGIRAILSLHPGPRFAFGSLRPEHRAVVERFFVLTRPQLMTRMAVTRDTFAPAEEGQGEAPDGPSGLPQVERLTARHLALVNRLYSAEGGPTAYRAVHLDEGVYYGVRVNHALVSIAGTHTVSRSEGVAVVGNVFTHPQYRNLGYSRLATSAVTAELLEACPLVVLTVETDNEPALAVYRKLGYTPRCTLHESPLIRKEPVGALSFVRRLVAGWRGRQSGNEVVVR